MPPLPEQEVMAAFNQLNADDSLAIDSDLADILQAWP